MATEGNEVDSPRKDGAGTDAVTEDAETDWLRPKANGEATGDADTAGARRVGAGADGAATEDADTAGAKRDGAGADGAATGDADTAGAKRDGTGADDTAT